MPNFFIEFRFHGHAKHQLKGLIREVATKFRVRGAIKYRPVPHMTLFYGFSGTTDIRKVCDAVERAGRNYSLVAFQVKGFEWHEGEEGKVIGAGINASHELKQLRQALVDELSTICVPHRFDTQPDFWFHTTIAFKDIDQKFDRIWAHLNEKSDLNINQHLIRITVPNCQRRIEREYDLILKRWLNRREALNAGLYKQTVNKLAELKGASTKAKVSLWHRVTEYVRRLLGGKSVYLIGDTHFDHDNIIKYCNRPFQNAEDMNKTLVINWNAMVAPTDTVYFLGDWSFGTRSRPPRFWVKRLKGHIISILGSHDNDVRGLRVFKSKVLRYKGYNFLLIHDPEKRDIPWHSWMIHGHKHNNDLRDSPFINGDRKTINVSVELIGYQPLNMDKLLSLDIDTIKRMETINSPPEKWQ